MHKFLRICWKIISAIVAVTFMFIPESLFQSIKIIPNVSNEINIIVNRVIFVLLASIFSAFLTIIIMRLCRKVIIKGKNYTIQVEYGDLNKVKKCKKIITFDECFTSQLGEAPSEIKPNSVCGQYLQRNSDLDIEKLIAENNIKPARTKSKFENKTRYNSGTIVPNGDDLLVAFARLDENGLGTFFSYKEFLECLATLWEEIDKYYAQKDVCIPIFGSGITRLDFTQQELLDIIIMTYQLNNHKIKKPYKLRIICKKNDGFSLNKIGESI